MEFVSVPSLEKRKNADVLVLPFWQGEEWAERAADIGRLKAFVLLPVDAGDFKGKAGEASLLYLRDQREKRCVLLGLGGKEDVCVETLRRSYAKLAKICHCHKITKANILVPNIDTLDDDETARGICEGLLLKNYAFTEMKSDVLEEDLPHLLEKVSIIGASKKFMTVSRKMHTIAEGVYMVRDLVNRNADIVTPGYFVNLVHEFEKEIPNLAVRSYDKKWLKQHNMGLLLAVNRSSANDPAFIVIEYKGNPSSSSNTVVIGKGVTYDTGGINLKTAQLQNMRCDMAGAAVALGAVTVAAKLGIKKNISAVIVATENCIGAKSYKCGDVYRGHANKTVEIISTDAEGRLILADALSYACQELAPTCIIDIATLTGAMEICLGKDIAGLMSNSDKLVEMLCDAGEHTFEKVWRLPLCEDYKSLLKSDIADIKNSSGVSSAASVAAGLFLEYFVDDNIKWAHIDIAGTAFGNKEKRYIPKSGTGWGVRLLVEFLENMR